METTPTPILKTGWHSSVGHACAVASAVATLLLLVIAMGLILADPARTYPGGGGFHLWRFVSGFVVIYMFLFGYVFAVAGLPVLLVDRAARRFGIVTVWYYLACGAMTGVLVGTLPFLGSLLAPPVWVPGSSVLKHLLDATLVEIPSGAVGGLAYWYVTGRYVGHPVSD